MCIEDPPGEVQREVVPARNGAVECFRCWREAFLLPRGTAPVLHVCPPDVALPLVGTVSEGERSGVMPCPERISWGANGGAASSVQDPSGRILRRIRPEGLKAKRCKTGICEMLRIQSHVPRAVLSLPLSSGIVTRENEPLWWRSPLVHT